MTKNNKSSLNRCKAVWEKSGGVCAHCGRKAAQPSRTVDHYIPRSWGSGYDMRNLMPLCKECNHLRDNRKINPQTYYKFASKEAIRQCLEYEQAFISSHRSMDGNIW